MKFFTTEKVFVIFAVLGALIVFGAFSVLKDAEHATVEQFASRQKLLAQQTLEGIKVVLKSVVGDAKYLASFPEIADLDTIAIKKHFWALYNARSSIVASITRMDSLGRIVVTVPYEEYNGTDISAQPHIRKILSSHKPVIGGPIRTVQNFDAIIYHHPVFTKDSVFTGTVAVLVSFDSLVNKFFNPIFKRNGQIVWLANTERKILIHSKKPPGIILDSLYNFIPDRQIAEFLNSFPAIRKETIIYKYGKNKRILVCQWANIGVDKWIVGLDTDYSLAVASLTPLRWKIFILTILSLLVAFLFMHLIISNAQKRVEIERQNEILKLKDEQRYKLNRIYKFAQSTTFLAEEDKIFEDLTELVSELCEVPMVLSWLYSENSGIMVPGPYVIKDFRLQDELRESNIDINHVELESHFINYFPKRSPSFTILGLRELKEKNFSVCACLYAVQNIYKFDRIAFVYLGLRDTTFGIVGIPLTPEHTPKTEILETLALAVSQALYVRSIIIELQKNSELYRDILENIDKAVFLVDSNMTLLSVSPEFYRIFGVRGTVIGKNLFEAVPFLKDIQRDIIYMEVLKNKTSIETEEIRIIDENRKIVTQTKIIPIVEKNGKVGKILTIVNDITEFRMLEEQLKRTAEELARKNRQLEKLAVTDELTRLRNYRYFTENLPRVIQKHFEEKKPMALLAMDLDNFKRYNDTYGHQAGDKLLAEVAEIVRGFLRTDDFAARYGGDEFVLVLSNCDADEAVDTAERLCAKIASTPMPDNMGQRTEHITASIGVAVMKDEFIDAEELLRRADTALYVSKARGKGRVTLYEVKIESET